MDLVVCQMKLFPLKQKIPSFDRILKDLANLIKRKDNEDCNTESINFIIVPLYQKSFGCQSFLECPSNDSKGARIDFILILYSNPKTLSRASC